MKKPSITVINFDEQIINQLEGKAKCIYDKFTEASSGFKNMLKQFDGEFPISHLKFTINNTLPDGNYGIPLPPVNYVTEIHFINDQLVNISVLGSVVSIANEMIHKEIFRKILSSAQRGDLDPDTITQQPQVGYLNSLRNNFSEYL
ncbi:hypothetical protein [Tenacibaculum sp. SG-28]|uniref:hypothetical protein n=1 Tax=Tenacibaculum sp. SG-28 TaxID=754426 RepID=UPI000CF4FC8A|nr:hypothetical protein [Tenacibaculum sp. SG-28]PQJ21566.1 hypothetical protein BSU00_05500 [Tenacibaculum sp. SG-28]